MITITTTTTIIIIIIVIGVALAGSVAVAVAVEVFLSVSNSLSILSLHCGRLFSLFACSILFGWGGKILFIDFLALLLKNLKNLIMQ